MKELLEVYTPSETFDKDEIETCVANINKVTGLIWEELARYCYQDENGINILVELQIPTAESFENGYHFIDIVAYHYEGEFEDYRASKEIVSVHFDGNWNTILEQMKNAAITACKELNDFDSSRKEKDIIELKKNLNATIGIKLDMLNKAYKINDFMNVSNYAAEIQKMAYTLGFLDFNNLK